jgi:hypothetical protein
MCGSRKITEFSGKIKLFYLDAYNCSISWNNHCLYGMRAGRSFSSTEHWPPMADYGTLDGSLPEEGPRVPHHPCARAQSEREHCKALAAGRRRLRRYVLTAADRFRNNAYVADTCPHLAHERKTGCSKCSRCKHWQQDAVSPYAGTSGRCCSRTCSVPAGILFPMSDRFRGIYGPVQNEPVTSGVLRRFWDDLGCHSFSYPWGP